MQSQLQHLINSCLWEIKNSTEGPWAHLPEGYRWINHSRKEEQESHHSYWWTWSTNYSKFGSWQKNLGPHLENFFVLLVENHQIMWLLMSSPSLWEVGEVFLEDGWKRNPKAGRQVRKAFVAATQQEEMRAWMKPPQWIGTRDRLENEEEEELTGCYSWLTLGRKGKRRRWIAPQFSDPVVPFVRLRRQEGKIWGLVSVLGRLYWKFLLEDT